MAIIYEITHGVPPLTVYLLQGLTLIDQHTHFVVPDTGQFNVEAGDYYLYVEDALLCYDEFPVTTTTTTTSP